MATPRARAVSTWAGLILLAALAGLTAWQPWLGFGLIIGVLGGAVTFAALLQAMVWLDDRDRLPGWPLAVGAVAASLAVVAVPTVAALLALGAAAAITAGSASAVLVLGFFGRIEVDRQLDRRRLRRLARALDAGAPLAGPLAQVPAPYLFVVAGMLADHGQWSALLDYLERTPAKPSQARYAIDWRIAAQLALGDVAAAQATLAAAPAPEGAAEQALAALQEARVAIARGDAAAALPALATPAEPTLGAALISARAAVHVDALVATGDDAGARAALRALRTRYGRDYVAQLGRRARPCSTLARELTADDAER